MTAEAEVETVSGHCPHCGAEWIASDFSAELIMQIAGFLPMICARCGGTWSVKYLVKEAPTPNTLLPCPFCGYAGQDQIKGDLYVHSEQEYDDAAYDDPEDLSFEPDLDDDRIVWHAVRCPGCCAMGPEHKTVQEARAAWQNRAG